MRLSLEHASNESSPDDLWDGTLLRSLVQECLFQRLQQSCRCLKTEKKGSQYFPEFQVLRLNKNTVYIYSIEIIYLEERLHELVNILAIGSLV
jgi:hypothetical protein